MLCRDVHHGKMSSFCPSLTADTRKAMAVKRPFIQIPTSYTSQFMSTWMASSILLETTEICSIVELDRVLGRRFTDFPNSHDVDEATETSTFPG
jgi:hypothetical protein